MVWTGPSPLAAVRAGLWGLLLFAAVSWLAIGWSVLRLEPSDVGAVAGAVILFGALTEALRACAGTRTWWLNAGMAVLFAATAVLLLTAQRTSYTAPLALIGWYLMVRGTVDIAVAVITRDSDRVWGLLLVVGVLEAGLGFFAASPLSRTADLVVTIVGALGLLRAVADLVTALRIREVRAARAKVPRSQSPGLAGYLAGVTDYEAVAGRGAPRHRATPAPGLATLRDRTVLSDRGALSKARSGSVPRMGPVAEIGPEVGFGTGPNESMWPGGPAATLAAAAATDRPANAFPDGVLRTTADLDAILALAGATGSARVTGTGVGARPAASLDGYVAPAPAWRDPGKSDTDVAGARPSD
jgi:hypothetical protein